MNLGRFEVYQYIVTILKLPSTMPEQSPFTIYTDEELMLLICNGETAGFEVLYGRYGKRMFLYFTRMLNFNQQEAKDALQNLFLKIAESPEKFDRSRSFQTWIYTIAANYCKNYYRHQSVKIKHAEELAGDPEAFNTSFDVYENMDAKLFRHMLKEALNDMPPEKKEAFILKYQEEKSIAEIAVIQACAEGTVKSRLYYAIQILEEKLKQFKPTY
jgi:RNA polymerase sigma-70 factor (ECF subfamily)